jgi:ABC-type multidrug transport system ATPase subunit
VSAALESPAAAVVSVEAREIAHRYGARAALLPISFSLEAPGRAAVTGSNGSGKSTLLRIVSGLLRSNAGALEVKVGGREVPPAERRRHVGLASPELAFYDEFTVAENLVFAAEARSLPQPHEAANEALERVGLAARAGDRVSALSSGMKQRLRLAFAVLHRPALLLLDEPGSHLDDAGREVVARLVEEQGRTGLVLLATNEEREWRLAGRRIQLRGGGLGDPA